MLYKIPPLRKPDNYEIKVHPNGVVYLIGKRSIGCYYYNSGKGKFCSKGWTQENLRTQGKLTDFPSELVAIIREGIGEKLNPENLTYKHYRDNQHGWLQVPLRILIDWNIQELISECSYINNNYAYLEEDRDLQFFLNEYETKFKSKPKVEIRYKPKSKVRDYKKYNNEALTPLITY